MYESTCKECVDAEGEPTVRYVGETARSISERWGDHQRDARNRVNDSHIWKHWLIEHGGEETEFQIQVIKFFDSPLDRQVSEAVRIERTGAKRILNSKSVYSRSRLPRIVTEDIQEETIGDSGKTVEETSGGRGEEQSRERPLTDKQIRKMKRKENLCDNLQWGRRKQPPPSLDESEDMLDALLDVLDELFEEDSHTLAHIPSITITPPTPPPAPHNKFKSCARRGPEGNLMERWLASGRGASMRSQEVAKITQPHTQPPNTSKGTPAVPLNSPTSTATKEEHLTLHRKSKEPEGDLEGLEEGGEATCTKFTNTHTTKFIPEKGQLSTCGDAGTISLPLAKALSHTEVGGGRDVCRCNGTTIIANVCHKNTNTYTTNHSLATGNPGGPTRSTP